jgi:aarF domain-containing kinase
VGPDNALKSLTTQVAQASELVQSLGRLKGAAMKVGQLISIEGRDFFPPEVLEVLSALQDSAPPMAGPEVERLLRSELGAERFAEIEDLGLQPLAAASIGQVHKARYRGQDIVLKVQYPGVASSIDTDLILLKNVARTALALSPKRSIPMNELFDEVALLLKQEVDYVQELELLGEYQKLFSKHPEYVFPKPVPELSTPTILAMSYEHGLRIQDYLRMNPTQQSRNDFGQKILNLYATEFFEFGLVQTDANFGNFLFRPDTSQVVCLDFGATRRYSESFRQQYRQLLKLVRDSNKTKTLSHCVEMELISDLEDSACKDAFFWMLRMSTEPFEAHRQPFRFEDRDYSRDVREAALSFTKLVKHSPPPHQLIFLHRKLGGVFNLLKTLGARIDLIPYWDRIVP